MYCMEYVNHIRYMQYLSSFIAALSSACAAMHSIWPSPSLPKLTSADSPIGTNITIEQSSWLVSTISLGIIFAACVKIFCAELCSPKTWILISGVFMAVPWIIIYLSNSIIPLIIARFLGGVGIAIAYATVPVYIAEISEKDIRGKLIIMMEIFTLLGTLFVLTVGPFLSFADLAVSCSVLPIVFVALFYLMPESPYYLVKVGQKNAAVVALEKLSSTSADSVFLSNRLAEIEETVNFDMRNKSSIWEFITKRNYRMSLVIMLGVKTLQQMCGINVINAYGQKIIASTNSSISPELSSILFGLVQVPAAIATSFLVDKAGRKPLLLLSAAGCAIALFGEGLYFFLNSKDSVAWLPTTCILLFFIMSSIGVIPLPFVLMGEIFATNIKGAAVSLSITYTGALSFIALKSFEPMAAAFGMHIGFWVFAGFCILGCCFIYFVIPETKGQSLEQIQTMINKDKRTNIFLNTKL